MNEQGDFMLNGIPAILSPEILKILMEMGHSDEIVIGDGNFPAASIAKRLIRSDGNNIPDLLDAILKFFPIDSYVEKPITLMAVTKGDPYKPTIWDEYKKIVLKYESGKDVFEMLEKPDFYVKARNAYGIIATSETALYANIILKKGVVI
jgi:L-fucose mutarotase